MYLSGSIREIRNIIMAAADLHARSIHFISPDIVFIIGKNDRDYIFAHTALSIGQSVRIPRSSYMNMLLYIKAAKKSFHKIQSPFYLEVLHDVCFYPGHIRFNSSEDLELEVDIPAFTLKKQVEFALEDSMRTSFTQEAPSLRVTWEQACSIQKQLTQYKNRYLYKVKRSSDNAIRLEDGQLVLYFSHDETDSRIETGIRDVSINDAYSKQIFTFSDRAFYLLRRLTLTHPVQEIFFYPRDRYCILEGHSSHLMSKVRTDIKNDLLLPTV